MTAANDFAEVSAPFVVEGDYYGFAPAADDLLFAEHALLDAADKLPVPGHPLSQRQAFARTVMLAEIDVAQAAIGRAKDAAQRAVQL